MSDIRMGEKRFRVIEYEQAKGRGLVDLYASDTDMIWCIIDTSTDPPTYVGDDRMEPEDALLSWLS